jgi:hypothetical protein
MLISVSFSGLRTFAIAVQVEFLNHCPQLLVVNVLSKFHGNVAQIPERYATGAVFVKELKSLANLLQWIAVENTFSH